MGRPRKQNREPFWRSDRACYYVQHGTRQIRLSPEKDEAWRLWHEFMARPPEQPKIIRYGQQSLVVEILDAFLDWALTNSSPRTYAWRQENIQIFARSIPPTLTVAELRPIYITREMKAHPTWGPDTRANFARCV
jgi:hypothetical protein